MDGVEVNFVLIPKVRIALEGHTRAMYPTADLKRPVVQQLVCVGTKATIGGRIEIFANGIERWEHEHFVEEGHRPL